MRKPAQSERGLRLLRREGCARTAAGGAGLAMLCFTLALALVVAGGWWWVWRTRQRYRAPLERGWALLAQQRVDEALASFELARQARPDDPATLRGLAASYLAKGQLAAAAACAGQAVAGDATPESHALAAEIALVAAGPWEPHAERPSPLADGAAFYLDKALEHAQAALAIGPDHPRALRVMGIAAARRQGPQSALPHILRAAEIDPDDRATRLAAGDILLLAGRRHEALAHYRHVAERLDPFGDLTEGERADMWRALSAAARVTTQLGFGDQAIAFWHRYLAGRGDKARGHVGLVMAHYAKGDYSQAIEESTRALKYESPLNPSWDLHYYRGLAFLKLKRLDRAADEFKVALSVRDDAEAQHLLGTALLGLRDRVGARQAFLAALAADPRHRAARQELVALLEADGEIPRALEELRRGAALAPEERAPRQALAAFCRRHGFHAEAEEALRALYALKPAVPGAAAELAEFYLERGDPERARPLVDEAVRLEPASPQLATLLGRIEAALGRTANAEALFERALGLHPGHAAAWLEWAAALEAVGLRHDAEETLARARKALPGSSRIRCAYASFCIATGRAEEGVEELQRLIERDRRDLAPRRLLVGHYLRAGSGEAALAQARDIVDALPESLEARDILASVYRARGEWDKVMVVLGQMARLPGGEAVLPQQLAAMVHEGLYVAALRLAGAEGGEPLTRGRAGRELIVAILHFLADRPDKALETIAAAENVNPRDYAAGFIQSLVQLALGQPVPGAPTYREFQIPLAARNAWDDLVRRRQRDAEKTREIVRFLLQAHVYDEVGWTDTAAEHVERILDVAPDCLMACTLAPVLWERAGNRRRAIATCQRALERAKGFDHGRIILGDLQLLEGQAELARAAYAARAEDEPAPFEARTRLALLEAAAGNSTAALSHWRAIHARQPRHVPASNNLAWALLELPEPPLDAVAEAAQDALDATPDDPVVLGTLGWVRLLRGEVRRAIDTLETAARAAPYRPIAQLRLGLAYACGGRPGDARQALERVLQLAPGETAADVARQALRQIELGLPPYLPVRALARASRSGLWNPTTSTARAPGGLFASWGIEARGVHAALAALERRDRDRDLSELSRALADDPADLRAAELLALRHWRKGMYPEAVALLRRILRLDPAFTSSRLWLAELFRELGSDSLAIKALADGIPHEPRSTHLPTALASLHAQRANYRRAAELWQDVLRLNPKNLQAHMELAKCLVRDGQQEAAKVAIGDASHLAPEAPAAQMDVAGLHRMIGNLRAAGETWTRLRADKAAGPSASLALALAHLHAGEHAEAHEELRAAGAEPEAQPAVLAVLAAAALGLGDTDAAVEWCRRLRDAGHGAQAAALLADVWLARGDAAAVQAVWAARGQEAERTKAAYQHLGATLANNPEARRSLALLLARAEALRWASWLEQATEAIAAARKIVPTSVLLAENLAELLAATGRPDEELALREELLQMHPDDPLVCQALVQTLLEQGHRARAREVNAAFLKRFFADLESRLAAARMAIAEGDYAQAIAHCQSVLANHPADERPYGILLDAMLRDAKLAEATSAIRGREGALPKFVPGPLEHAILALAEGDPEKALVHARRGRRRSPADHRLWLAEAAALEALGHHAQAIPCLQAAAWLLPGQFSAQLVLARAAARSGNTAVAVDAYRAAITIAPEARDVRLEFADALTHWGHQDEAVAMLASLEAPTTASRDPITVRLAEAYLAKDDPAKALELVRDILARDPADAVARPVALAACRALGDLPAATRFCELAARQNPTPAVQLDLGLLYLIQQRYKDAEERLADGAQRAEGAVQRLELRTLQAIACIALEQPQKALRVLEDAARARPADGPLAADLALALATVRADAQARTLIAQAEKANPTRGGWLRTAAARLPADRLLPPLVLVGRAAAAAGWHARAAELLNAAAARAPDEPLILHDAARALAEARRFDDALALARRLDTLTPNAPEALLLRADILEHAGKTRDALAALAQAFPLLGKQPDAITIAERFRAAGKTDQAIEICRAALEAEPVNPQAARALASLYASHKPDLLPEAEKLARAAASAAPNDPAARDTLGWVLFLLKRPDEARAELTAAIALEPLNATYYYHLGMADYVRGRHGRARRALEAALRLDPKLTDADTARSTLQAIEADPGG